VNPLVHKAQAKVLDEALVLGRMAQGFPSSEWSGAHRQAVATLERMCDHHQGPLKLYYSTLLEVIKASEQYVKEINDHTGVTTKER